MAERQFNLVVAQLGARRHYAIPRMLFEAGMLAHFYTDICATKGWPRLLNIVPTAMQSAGIKRLLGRIPHGVPARYITTFTRFSLEYQSRRVSAKSYAEAIEASIWSAKRFCELVLASGLHDAGGVYTFNSAGLELLTEARKRGLRAIVEQTIAPMEVENRLMQAEHGSFPGWESVPVEDTAWAEFAARERAEWAMADTILCGSEFVRDSITACGGHAEKCRVVPYGVDARFSLPDKAPHHGPLRVLTVGAVGLRKGSPYVLEAARMLRGQADFRMVGNLGVQPTARQALAGAVELTGPVPRTQMLQHYAWADVFLLPSICEGSAGVVYEALAAGLPVVCTPNTGSVVRDGVDGFIVPIRDAAAITEALSGFLQRHELLRRMSEQARLRAQAFGLEPYKAKLISALGHGLGDKDHVAE